MSRCRLEAQRDCRRDVDGWPPQLSGLGALEPLTAPQVSCVALLIQPQKSLNVTRLQLHSVSPERESLRPAQTQGEGRGLHLWKGERPGHTEEGRLGWETFLQPLLINASATSENNAIFPPFVEPLVAAQDSKII